MLHKSYKRRRFLQTAALVSGGVITSLAHARLTSASEQPVKDEPIEALIIGSGFGGAIAALHLGKAGINTVILERGRRWPITPEGNTFATFQKPDGRAAWLSTKTYSGVPVDRYTGVLELTVEDGIQVLRGAGVGGGSLVYNAITYQPHREIFYKVFPPSIDYDELDQVYYPRVRSILKPAPIPQDILATPYYERTRLFLQQATKAGFPNRLYDINVEWNIIREEINGTKVPSAIIGNHWFGINSGAKNSVDHNYLPQAEKTGFVEILPLHVATAITEVPGAGYRVSCTQIDETGQVVEEKSFTCRYLFLAAGSIGTSRLLVKAKATGALPKLNDYIGKGWGSNGDTVSIRSNLPPLDGKLVSHSGGPAAAVLEHLDNPIAPVCLEDLLDPLAPDGTIQMIGVGIPPQRGTFAYDKSTDSVKLTWPNNSAILEAAQLTCRILDKRNTTLNFQPQTEVRQGVYWNKNRSTSSVSVAVTAHPLGGAVLGQACDLYGRVYGYQGLYVVDGALIPGSAGSVNPAFTIAAIAERCMDRIIAEDIR